MTVENCDKQRNCELILNDIYPAYPKAFIHFLYWKIYFLKQIKSVNRKWVL